MKVTLQTLNHSKGKVLLRRLTSSSTTHSAAMIASNDAAERESRWSRGHVWWQSAV